MHFFISLVIFFPEDTIGILRYFFGKVIEYFVELFQILTKVQMVEEYQLVGKLIFFIIFLEHLFNQGYCPFCGIRDIVAVHCQYEEAGGRIEQHTLSKIIRPEAVEQLSYFLCHDVFEIHVKAQAQVVGILSGLPLLAQIFIQGCGTQGTGLRVVGVGMEHVQYHQKRQKIGCGQERSRIHGSFHDYDQSTDRLSKYQHMEQCGRKSAAVANQQKEDHRQIQKISDHKRSGQDIFIPDSVMILMKSPAGQRRCQIGNSGHHKDGEGQKGIFPADIFREDDQYFQVSNIETEQGQKTDMVDGPEDPE